MFGVRGGGTMHLQVDPERALEAEGSDFACEFDVGRSYHAGVVAPEFRSRQPTAGSVKMRA